MAKLISDGTELLSISNLARKYKVKTRLLRHWLSLKPEDVVIDCLKRKISPFPQQGRRPTNYYLWEGERLTIKQIAEKLKVSKNTVRTWLEKKKEIESLKHKPKPTLTTQSVLTPPDEVINKIAKRNGALLCINPRSKEEFPPFYLAEKYNIPLQEMNQAIKKYGANSVKLFDWLEEKQMSA